MPKIDSETVRDQLAQWVNMRKDFQARSGAPKQGDVDEFLKGTRNRSKAICATLDLSDPELMEALAEAMLTAQAETKMPGFIA